MQNVTAVDFVFARFGRHIAPESSGAWLRTNGLLLKDSKSRKAGERNAGMGGTAVYVSDSEVKVFGSDYRDCGFASCGDIKSALALANAMIFRPAVEQWVMAVYDKAHIHPNALYLNQPGLFETAYYNGKRKSLVRARPSVLQRAAHAFVALDSMSAVDVTLRYLRRHIANDINPDNKADAELTKKVLRITEGRVSELITAVRLLMLHGIDDAQFRRFIEFSRENSHV